MRSASVSDCGLIRTIPRGPVPFSMPWFRSIAPITDVTPVVAASDNATGSAPDSTTAGEPTRYSGLTR
ncbi:MAG: hypothetical protein ABEI52_10535, partial [Halobacteriaceae archaeon]